MTALGLRKLDTDPKIADRLERIRNGHGPTHVETPPTVAEIAREIGAGLSRVAGLIAQLSDALEREEERIDSELVSLARALDADTRTRRWPERMYRADAAAYLGVSPSTLEELVRQGLVGYVSLPGLSQRSYRRTDLDAYIAGATSAERAS